MKNYIVLTIMGFFFALINISYAGSLNSADLPECCQTLEACCEKKAACCIENTSSKALADCCVKKEKCCETTNACCENKAVDSKNHSNHNIESKVTKTGSSDSCYKA